MSESQVNFCILLLFQAPFNIFAACPLFASTFSRLSRSRNKSCRFVACRSSSSFAFRSCSWSSRRFDSNSFDLFSCSMDCSTKLFDSSETSWKWKTRSRLQSVSRLWHSHLVLTRGSTPFGIQSINRVTWPPLFAYIPSSRGLCSNPHAIKSFIPWNCIQKQLFYLTSLVEVLN